jgi:hypothetical protein
LQHAHAIGNEDILPVGITKLDHLDLYFSHRGTYSLYPSNQLQILVMERSISPGVKEQTAGRVESTIRAAGSWNFFEGGMKKYANARQAIWGKRDRMLCAEFRGRGLFVGSEVRNAGCRSVSVRRGYNRAWTEKRKARTAFALRLHPPQQPMGNDAGPQAAVRRIQQPTCRPFAIPAL